ncbi:prolyl aminopeptidase [Occultella glacieicola]|uniref:Proline iminopeptidase n=1 Tax=Occultella glacieicola TaxID=2518684 RepID=A0ABY2EAU8_9MICO|nr:prolyl aminopeptidase [Occultella glacieicola]TDE97349.1 prolyl aminopeptidase [Occultella glacieicola]
MTTSDDSPLYPAIDPYESGMLAVGDGHELYWEVSGNPDGAPVVFLHGGPGGATNADQRRFFDPAVYRIVLFDQRGCGRSTPHASAPGADLSANTTWHLVADIEALRDHLGVASWHVFGGSWGSALALAYAQQYAERVRSLVLRGIFTLRKAELDWFYEGGASAIFPDWFERYIAPVPPAERGDCIGAFHRLLHHPDPAVHGPAAVAWSTWEAATTSLLIDAESIEKFSQPEFALAFARIENHYFVHKGWFTEGQLIEGATALADIPGVIVQGRYDACTPATTAWDLHRAWPEAEFVMVPDAGHASLEPGIARALVAATDAMARLPQP